jgi:Ca2+-binding RTX toxin-like protein
MRGIIAINCTAGGNKKIVNHGLIESTDYGNGGAIAIALLGGDDELTNTGTIRGDVTLGEGNDLLINTGTFVNDVYLGGGHDFVSSSANGSFRFVSCGDGADLFSGSNLSDFVDGGQGEDLLFGNAGDDVFYGVDDGGAVDSLGGGTGSDRYSVYTEDRITENVGEGFDAVLALSNYTLAAGVEVEKLSPTIGFTSLTLTGNEFVQTISGSSGNDTLSGGGSGDTLIGLGGDDTYALEAFFATVTDSAGAADTITSTVTRSLASFAGIERLTLLGGTAAINGTGNGLANIITGNEGANVLDGGLLGDTLNGAGGNDVFLYASQAAFAGDIVNGGAGTLDRIRFTSAAPGQTLVLSNQVTQVEIAEISTAAGAITGTTTLHLNALAVASAMQLTGNNGINIIQGTNFANTMSGNGGADTLLGNGGADLVIGGAGRDTMTGGLLNDTFRFLSTADSPTLALADVITDFDRAGMGDDRIDVSGLFGPALAYRGAGLFTAAGQLRINDIAGVDLLVEVNTGGTLAADFTVRLTNTTFASMAPSDFILL